MTYHELVKEGQERLYQAGQGEQAAQVLMVELCRQKEINLYLEMDNDCPEALMTDYLEGIHEMEKGEPLGYVLGYEWFYGYDFIVNPDVLIPRPETEELVGLVLQKFDEKFSDREQVTVFDVATGSGAIGISLNKEEPRMHVIASDISAAALKVARANREKFDADVQLIRGDMLEPFIDRDLHCDICVCNPPYIPQAEKMEHSVVDYEPHVALFGGEDGLKFYRDVFAHAEQVCRPDALLAFEIGYDQRERLTALAKSYFPQAVIEVHQDMSGKDRMLTIEK
ncbi:peptide chain release factor N(5)-glutamine methyltransferase [Catenisphaera adipataccumulans]|jgi:release factor glutamine methyltransferase|uniref:peptide chain release factor N(5)-glutamine methyltransferase n=1 Tax=Catenisphaera adipataccumulans TaxID=700500 RepID=A0A7W8D0L6_9FIRM|nr:peptide chain release factor N(5)-glutamine methyltransferase [Catenisphaera adipataccumulans]MBB5183365.1 release factor glutamine methyltransferase [Catenisphaera adipataccumulans]